jgi:hypothetical protein
MRTWTIRIGGREFTIKADNAGEALTKASAMSGVLVANIRIVQEGATPGSIPADNNNLWESFNNPTTVSEQQTSVLPAAVGGQLEQQAPFGAFTNFLGAFGLGPDTPRSAARTFAESQFDPLHAAFAGQQLLQPIQEGDPNQGSEFASFLTQGGINPRQRLGDAFRGLQFAAGQPGLDPESIFAKALNAQIGGERGEASDIFNLARQIQRSSFSPLISGQFPGQSNRELFERFAAQRARAAASPSSISGLDTLGFARQQFGLGGLGFAAR